MAITVFWDVTSCSLIDIQERFGGIYCFHLHGMSREGVEKVVLMKGSGTRTETAGGPIGDGDTGK
jgi:hypothetical protein